jgi:hypothetical protein
MSDSNKEIGEYSYYDGENSAPQMGNTSKELQENLSNDFTAPFDRDIFGIIYRQYDIFAFK